MNKIVKLKNGSEVRIREMRTDDLERSFAFFKALPKEDRINLRVDVTKKEIVEKRIQSIKHGNVIRLVAIDNDQIIADGALELETQEWESHIAELRLIVAHSYQRKGLGMLMARELFLLAASKNVEEIIVRFTEPQKGAKNIFKKLGFHRESVLHNYAKDIDGSKHDLVLMRCDLNSLWGKLEYYIEHFDMRGAR